MSAREQDHAAIASRERADVVRAFQSDDGKKILKWLRMICGQDMSSVVKTANGSIDLTGTAINEARRGVYLDALRMRPEDK